MTLGKKCHDRGAKSQLYHAKNLTDVTMFTAKADFKNS